MIARMQRESALRVWTWTWTETAQGPRGGQGLHEPGRVLRIRSEEAMLITDPTRMGELLVGLPDANVISVSQWPQFVRIAISIRAERPTCPNCRRIVRPRAPPTRMTSS